MSPSLYIALPSAGKRRVHGTVQYMCHVTSARIPALHMAATRTPHCRRYSTWRLALTTVRAVGTCHTCHIPSVQHRRRQNCRPAGSVKLPRCTIGENSPYLTAGALVKSRVLCNTYYIIQSIYLHSSTCMHNATCQAPAVLRSVQVGWGSPAVMTVSDPRNSPAPPYSSELVCGIEASLHLKGHCSL